MAREATGNVTGVVLAAGAGSRMGGPKAELVLDGERLVDRAVRILRAAGCEPVIAVVREATAVPDARVVVNPDPQRGMRSSLELAVTAAPVGAVAVLLADLPGIGVDAVRAVIGAWRPGRITIAVYDGERSHPVVAPTMLWNAALTMAAPDEGARAFMAAHPEYVDPVSVAGNPVDLDTPDDVRAWEQQHPPAD